MKSIRWPSDGKLEEYISLREEEDKLRGDEMRAAKSLSEISKQISLWEKGFEMMYAKQQSLNRAAFSAIAGNEVLQKGLLQSSPALWQGVQRYRLQAAHVYRKKERQTERSLAQYLSRICAKTSPFSTFTALSMNDLSGVAVTGETRQLKGKVRINNYVFAQLQELLSGYRPIYLQLKLRINPTLIREEENYVFLLNSRNVESIQRVEQSGIVELILTVIEQQSDEIVLFEYLVIELLEKVEAEKAQLEAYLIDIIRYGLLVWEWPVAGTNPNWSKEFLKWSRALKPFEGKKMLVNTLTLLEENAGRLAILQSKKRWDLLQESWKALMDCFQTFSKLMTDIVEKKEDTFVTFQNRNFELSAERLYFEDTHFSAKMDWPEEALLESVEIIALLAELMAPLQIYPHQAEVLDFFKRHYTAGVEIPLLTFYETFYKEEKRATPLEVSQILNSRIEFLQILEKDIKIDSFFDVDLSLSRLRMIIASLDLKRSPNTTIQNAFGALLQLYLSKTGYKAYVDAAFIGYGKMPGRFLHLFPDKYTVHLSNWISTLKKEAIWVDNTDASFHNANAHPPILEYCFAMPGGQQHDSKDIEKKKQNHELSLLDLFVSIKEEDNRLFLKHKGEEITVFDLGLEALASRSPMYRMLSTFSLPQPDLSVIKNLLLKASQQKIIGGWIRIPRITISSKLVMQRKAWFLPISELPLRKKNESEAAYFLRINYWRKVHQLPEVVFVTIEPTEVEGTFPPKERQKGEGQKSKKTVEPRQNGSDGHKPHYIDFRTPALVSHFGRVLPKVKMVLKIEEMLPEGEEMLEVNGEKRVTEFVVQWETSP